MIGSISLLPSWPYHGSGNKNVGKWCFSLLEGDRGGGGGT